jgi:hypothetical protein
MVCLTLLAGLAGAGEVVDFRDPQGRFAFRHPKGWNVAPAPNGQAVSIIQGTVQGGLLLNSELPEGTTAQQVIGLFVMQCRRGWKDVKVVRSGAREFGGKAGAEALLTGVDANGIARCGHFGAVGHNAVGYIFVLGGPQKDAEAALPAWEIILKSFAFGKEPAGGSATTPVPTPRPQPQPGPGAKPDRSSPVGAWRYANTASVSWDRTHQDDYYPSAASSDRITLVVRPDGTFVKTKFHHFILVGNVSAERKEHKVLARGTWKQKGDRLSVTLADGTRETQEFKVQFVKDGRQLLIREVGQKAEIWRSSRMFQRGGLSFWYPGEWKVVVQKGSIQLVPPQSDVRKEFYVIGIDPVPAGLTAPDDKRLINEMDGAFKKIVSPKLKWDGEIGYMESSAGKAAVLDWETDLIEQLPTTGNDTTAEVRAYVTIVNGKLVRLVCRGQDRAIYGRADDLFQIFASAWYHAPATTPARPRPAPKTAEPDDELGGF